MKDKVKKGYSADPDSDLLRRQTMIRIQNLILNHVDITKPIHFIIDVICFKAFLWQFVSTSK